MLKYNDLRRFFGLQPYEKSIMLQQEMSGLLDVAKSRVTALNQIDPREAQHLLDVHFGELLQIALTAIERISQEISRLTQYIQDTAHDKSLLNEDDVQVFRHEVFAPLHSLRNAASLLVIIDGSSVQSLSGNFEPWARELVQATHDLMDVVEALTNSKDR